MTSKKKGAPEAIAGQGPQARGHVSAAYEAAVADYGRAVELLYRGEFLQAQEMFTAIGTQQAQELHLAERCRTYVRVCEQRLAPPAAEPTSEDECYVRAVQLCNEGRSRESLAVIDRALAQQPNSVRCLYVRATAWALESNPEAALADLRQAITLDPKVRYQVANDPDFEKIRENPSFIDLIEPTPAGA